MHVYQNEIWNSWNQTFTGTYAFWPICVCESALVHVQLWELQLIFIRNGKLLYVFLPASHFVLCIPLHPCISLGPRGILSRNSKLDAFKFCRGGTFCTKSLIHHCCHASSTPSLGNLQSFRTKCSSIKIVQLVSCSCFNMFSSATILW